MARAAITREGSETIRGVVARKSLLNNELTSRLTGEFFAMNGDFGNVGRVQAHLHEAAVTMLRLSNALSPKSLGVIARF